MGIPAFALILGLAGLIPFLYGAAASLIPAMALPSLEPGATLSTYGVIIFAYMSGCFWGFAAKAEAGAPWLILAVSPAVLAFLLIMQAPSDVLRFLVAGFPALLFIDRTFQTAGFAPPWWMRLRLILTTVVTLSLAAAIWA